MKHQRVGTALAAATIMTLGLSACVGNEAPEQATTSAPEDAVELRLSHVYEPSHPVQTCGVPSLNGALEGSGVFINAFPAAQLGSEAESLEQVVAGSLELAVAGPSFLGVWEPNVALFDAPYLFRDVDDFVETLDGPVADEIFASLKEESGLDVLGTWYYGTRHVTSKEPVSTSADLAGKKLRTPDAPLYLTMADIMGGAATPMALSEAYLGLQQGTIDAQENPIPTIASQRFYEVQDYLNLTGHIIQGVMFVGSDASLSALSDEQRAALQEAMVDASAAVRECIEDEEASFVEEWREAGTMQINDDVDVEHFRQRALEMIPDSFEWGDLYLEIREG